MSQLNLTGQQNVYNLVAPKIQELKNAMDARKNIWNKLPIEKKKKWVTSGKDPIMNIAWSVYKYLRNNFFSEEIDNG